jgi:hypothetical protein
MGWNYNGKDVTYDPYAQLGTPSQVFQPTTGETPLADVSAPTTENPIQGGILTDQYNTFNAFRKQFGRNPTQSELASLTPSFGAGQAYTGGPAAVAAYYNSLANTPSNIAANQQKQGLDAYGKDKGTFDTQTNNIFQQTVGRDATADEASHFGALLASKQIDTYGLQQLLGQSQEAQQRQTSQYQDTLSKNLQSTQGDYFKNQIEPQILAQTVAAGRDPNSSGVQNAEVQAGKQQNYDLQNYLAQFGASQYGQSAANQQSVYQQYLGNLYGLQNAGVTQALGQQNYRQQQNTNLANMKMQQDMYNSYLASYGKRGGGWMQGALSGAIGGATVGASAGGTWGAVAGGLIGGGLGYAANS